MKVIENTEKPAFKPVHIVLETQGEVDLIANLLGQVSIDTIDILFGVNANRMYKCIFLKSKTEYRTRNNIIFELETKKEVNNV